MRTFAFTLLVLGIGALFLFSPFLDFKAGLAPQKEAEDNLEYKIPPKGISTSTKDGEFFPEGFKGPTSAPGGVRGPSAPPPGQ